MLSPPPTPNAPNHPSEWNRNGLGFINGETGGHPVKLIKQPSRGGEGLESSVPPEARPLYPREARYSSTPTWIGL